MQVKLCIKIIFFRNNLLYYFIIKFIYIFIEFNKICSIILINVRGNIMNSKIMNMCMIYNEKGEVLVQDRIKENWKGIAFPGGKAENNESILDSTIREVKEETGLDISNLESCGYKNWVKDNVRNIVFLFKTKTYSGNLIEDSVEGKHFWVSLNELNKLKLASGFSEDLEMFLNDNYIETYFNKDENNNWKRIML
jgi:8-oxo-dGTP diphosphatase